MTVCRITISDRIKDYRKQNHLSQSDFGEMLGVSPQAVYKWEKEICYPDITLLPDLAGTPGCMIDDFFG